MQTHPPASLIDRSLAPLRLVLLPLALLAGPIFAAAAEPPLPIVAAEQAGLSTGRLDALNLRLQKIVDEKRASGFITLVCRKGDIVDWRAYGQRDIEAGLPMEKDSIVRIYSMTKIIASVGVLTLFEEGKLQLDDPVEKYIPELKDRKVITGGTTEAPELRPAEKPVTIRQLLTHTAGYIYVFSKSGALEGLYEKADLFSATNSKDFIDRVATLPLANEPGTAFRYGISFDILGVVIERVSGKSLPAFFQERIFAPLQMVDSGFGVPVKKRPRLAKVYRRNGSGQLLEAGPRSASSVDGDKAFQSCGGGMFSTAADYARFAQMLLNGGVLDGKRILGRKTVELMTLNHLAHLDKPYHSSTPAKGFGLGVEVMIAPAQSATLGSVGQFGWYGVATTLCQIDPREQLVMIALFQHLPMDEAKVFNSFVTGVESAIVD